MEICPYNNYIGTCQSTTTKNGLTQILKNVILRVYVSPFFYYIK